MVAGIGLIGLFPAGLPETRTERLVLRAAATAAVALPVLSLVVFPTPPAALFEPAQTGILSPLYVLLRGQLTGPRQSPRCATPSPCWAILGLVLLYLRYLRGSGFTCAA